MKLNLLIWVLFPLSLSAQITIDDCYLKAEANYPLVRQRNLIEQTKQYNLANANRGYLPQLRISAKATYQSEVTELPFEVPGIDPIKHDQYNAVAEINQTLWDGGAIRSRKANVQVESTVDRLNLEVSLYNLKQQVNQLFFGLLLIDENLERNRLLREDLGRTYRKIEGWVTNGIALRSDLDAIRVEQIKADQGFVQLRLTRKSYIEVFSTLLGEPLDSTSRFARPELPIIDPKQIDRPELALFEVQKLSFDVRYGELLSGIMPRFNFFVQGGYGRPALNMLKNDFRPFYYGGVTLSWNLGGLYTLKNSRRAFDLGKQSIDAQRDAFMRNTDLEVTAKMNDADNLRAQIGYDDEIVRLRHNVRLASETRLKAGTLTAADLMRDVTAEDLAIRDKIFHEIELLMALFNLRYITNQ